MFISFSKVNIQDLSKCHLLQDCCMGERVKLYYETCSRNLYNSHLVPTSTGVIIGTYVELEPASPELRGRQIGKANIAPLNTNLYTYILLQILFKYIAYVLSSYNFIVQPSRLKILI